MDLMAQRYRKSRLIILQTAKKLQVTLCNRLHQLTYYFMFPALELMFTHCEHMF